MPQSDYSEASDHPAIRGMRADELAPLADLWVASWQEAMPAIDFAARWAWISAVLANPANTTLVFERDGSALGFAILEGALLHQLVVARAAKGSGVAVALVAAVKAQAPGGLALEVNQDNPRAVRFYLREGFRRTGEGRNAGSGLATWHMRWP